MTPHRSNTLILLIAFSIIFGIAYQYWPDIQLAYATEEAPLAWVQSSLLVGCAITSALHACMPKRSPTDWVWPYLAIALVLAALDERFMYHEAIQAWLRYEVLGDKPWAARATSAITLAYALAGLVMLTKLKQAMSAIAYRWLSAAVVTGIIAVAMDLAFNDLSLQIIEELLEATAECLFLCGLFTEARTRVQASS